MGIGHRFKTRVTYPEGCLTFSRPLTARELLELRESWDRAETIPSSLREVVRFVPTASRTRWQRFWDWFFPTRRSQ